MSLDVSVSMLVHPIVAKRKFLNRPCQFLLDLFDFHIHPVHDKKQEYDHHSKKRTQAGTLSAGESDRVFDDAWKERDDDNHRPYHCPEKEDLKRFRSGAKVDVAPREDNNRKYHREDLGYKDKHVRCAS